MDSLKLAIFVIALIAVVGTASSTTLRNIEEIQPVGDQPIQITGDLDLNNNAIDRLGVFENCGANQYLNGNGECTTDSYDPDSVIPDDQSLSISGHTISLDNGGQVTVPDNYAADDQSLSEVLGQGASVGSGQTLDASSGAFRLPVGADAY